MKITYNGTKDCCYYRDYLENPTDRTAIKKFSKHFGENLMSPASKLHQRLKISPNANEYNKLFGANNNKIELMQDTKDNESLILKTRVTSSYRKFFNYIINTEEVDFLKKKDWLGQFSNVENIHVIGINNHEYKKV